MEKRYHVKDIRTKAEQGEKLVMLTAYDAALAKLADEAGVDMILVGDSLGTVSLGYDSPIPLTMDEMICHTKAVVRGSKKAMVVADMPYGSYHLGEDKAVENALRLIKEAGAGAVKIEGGKEILPLITRMTRVGIPVMCHIGHMPQTSWLWEDEYTHGRDEESAWELVDTAQEMEEAGAFSLFLHCVAAEAAELMATKVDIPIIGMGSGNKVDGQAQLIYDVIGVNPDPPMHARRFSDGAGVITTGIKNYAQAVRNGSYPDEFHMELMEEDEAKRLG